jgi:teichuronic acid biosynthesis glycosyltransferase TuaG
MSKLPLVSVVIPTHNRPDFLKRAIQSIIAQTYQEIEIIVISNGYNEINRHAAQSFRDARIIYVEQEDSGGPASPRNHGMRIAKGDYIAFCDDDDIWMPDKLEKQIMVLEENLEYGLCYSNMLRFDDQNVWFEKHEQGYATFNSLLYINTVPISSVIVRKNLLNRVGLFCESKIVGDSEDYEFLLRYAIYTKFYYIDEFLIKYWSGDNRKTKYTLQYLNTLKYFCRIMGCYYRLICISPSAIRQILPAIFYNIKNLMKSLIFITLNKLNLKK